MNKKINPEIIDEMVEYFKTHTASETEKKFGVSEGLPRYYYIKKYGDRKQSERRALTREEAKEIAEFAAHNTIASTMQKFNLRRASVLHHYSKYFGKIHPCQVRSILKRERGNECRQNGDIKRVCELSVGEWFLHIGQSYRVTAKTGAEFICHRYDYSAKIFNGKLELGIRNQMKVQTLVLKEPDELVIKSRNNLHNYNPAVKLIKKLPRNTKGFHFNDRE